MQEAGRVFAGSVAASGGGRVLRYAELFDRAHALASALRAQALTADEPVHVRVSNDPLDLAAILGVWIAGGVAVPIHRTTPSAVNEALRVRTAARLAVDLRDDAASDVSTIGDARPAPRPLLAGAAFVIFTSGSTGTPKGVVVPHAGFHGKIGQIDRLLRFGPGERTLLVLNLTFSFGLWVSLLTLLRGGRLVMAGKFAPEAFLDALATERIVRVGMVPTMMRALFADPRLDARVDEVVRQQALRQILIGGEPLGRSLSHSIRGRFRGTDLVDIYGLTETSTCDFFAFPPEAAAHPGCIGRPSPNVAYRIVDADGHRVATGSIGELQLRSPYLMSGYLDAPALTAAAYCDGWFRTGDLAREVGDAVVELMGRSKEIISRGGNKVTPGEIEQSLCSHPDVAAAMAVGGDDPILGERIHALVVARAGATLDIAVLKRHLRTGLERFKHPDVYYLAAALPLGRTGKADRGQFKRMIEAGEIVPVPVDESPSGDPND